MFEGARSSSRAKQDISRGQNDRNSSPLPGSNSSAASIAVEVTHSRPSSDGADSCSPTIRPWERVKACLRSVSNTSSES
jgi:hypothetical protein